MNSENIERLIRSLGYLLNPDSRARDGASACTVRDDPFDEVEVMGKWLDGPQDIKMETPRSTAFLAAYAMIFGNGIGPRGCRRMTANGFVPIIPSSGRPYEAVT